MPAVSFRRLRAVLLMLLAGPAGAAAQPPQPADVMAPVRADRWADADAAAAAQPDPVARKLVLYYRLLAPGAASAAEIARFMADSPDWPFPASLAKRREEAVAASTDDADVAAQCDQQALESAAALGRCAAAYSLLDRATDAVAFARRAWIALPPDPVAEAAFLARWGVAIGRAEQYQRFDRLAWSDTAAAARQAARLDPLDQTRAEARLALRRDDPNALAAVQALPEPLRSDPALVLEQARYLRRAGLDPDAVRLWTTLGGPAERAAALDRLPAFWDERNILARHRLRDNDPQGAYAVASGHAQRAPEQVAEAEFLAGFIALRRLNDPAGAERHFRVLADVSKAAITQGRAHFWLARASSGEAAQREYQLAAAYPNTFYGQLASLALGEGAAGLAARIAARRDPGWDAPQALGFAGRELARASAYLAAWGEPHRAEAFLLRLAEVAPDPADRAMAARLALGFGLTDAAVALARKAGRDGVVLLDTGWPQAADVPAGSGVEPALALGIIRQESSFDSNTISPVGARGLMQLMPATATQVAHQIGLRTPLPSLTGDPALNIQLGTAYLRGLMEQFDNCTPMAVAGYNAGPQRVTDWIANNGDPRSGGEMLDWIELIPFGETRNYVQRVIENEVVYRAKRGEVAAHPLAQWMR